LDNVDLAIVGAGIAGSALAAALADTGLSVVLIDKRNSPLDTARGDHIQPSMLDVLEKWGVLDRLIKAGAERRHGTRWFDAAGHKILSVPVPEGELRHPWFLFLNHELIGNVLMQRALEGRLQSWSGVQRWHVERNNDKWLLNFDLADGTRIARRATLLVGADGAGSLMRTRLHIETTRHHYQYPIAVLYGKARELPEKRTLDVHLTRDRMVSLIPRVQGGSKIGFPIDASELSHWRSLSSADICATLRAWSSAIDLTEAEFGAIYPPVSLSTAPWRGPGPAVLIGDASHAMHPARSMGMNTCFRVAEQLRQLLQPLASGFLQADATAILAHFEDTFRPELEQRLAENHAAGVQMDTLNGEGFQALSKKLEAVKGDNTLLTAMARNAAGLS